jgi:hypothetical protein
MVAKLAPGAVDGERKRSTMGGRRTNRSESMIKEFLGDRKKALEESFFARENANLLERLKAERGTQETREALAIASGIESDEILEKLCALGIDADTWTAVSIAPLVEVAWADGKIDESEHQAVLSGAEANGIASGSPGYVLLESWLAHRPDGRLLEVWGAFIVGLCAEMGALERESLKNQILGRARSVAEATGGFLGLGNKISDEEEVILAELAKAFEA